MSTLLINLMPSFVIIIVLAYLVATAAFARRHGYSGIGGEAIVRCSQGHLFMTLWVPGASFKAVRFGLMRFQYCPVGKHWAFVSLVKDSDLTDAQRQEAARYHDVHIP